MGKQVGAATFQWNSFVALKSVVPFSLWVSVSRNKAFGILRPEALNKNATSLAKEQVIIISSSALNLEPHSNNLGDVRNGLGQPTDGHAKLSGASRDRRLWLSPRQGSKRK